MTAVRRLCFGLMLMGMGAVFPAAAYANEVTEASEANLLVEPAISRAAPLDFEIRLTQSDAEALTYEHGFSGYENEIVVAYWESDGLRYSSEIVLYDAVGQLVPEVDYPSDIDINELEGRNQAYRLPATGEYRFVLTGSPNRLLDESEYFLRLRVATFYERAMMLAVQRLDDEDLEASRLGFEMAIAQRPDSIMPYIGRLVTMWLKAAESTGLDDMEDFTLERLSQLYQSLEADDQSLVLSDLQQVSTNFMSAVEAGVVEVDALDFDMSLLRDVSDYFETGEASEALQAAMQ